jgi:membrane-bound lytic murein transglycosylase B
MGRRAGSSTGNAALAFLALVVALALTLIAVEVAQGEELPPSDDPSTPGIECPPDPADPTAPPVVVADPADCPGAAEESAGDGSSEPAPEPEPEPEPTPSPGSGTPEPNPPTSDPGSKPPKPVPGQDVGGATAGAESGGAGNGTGGGGGDRDPDRGNGSIGDAEPGDRRGDAGDGDDRARDRDRDRDRAAEPNEPFVAEPAFGIPHPVGSPIPSFLLPIFEQCGKEYGIPWQVLAAINQVETAFGSNLNVSSAGAVGWMQFLPSSWQAYGVDANGDGRRDPYDPEDAICAAGNYLRAFGAPSDLRGAIFAYNHADWYVEMVMDLARQYARIDALDPLPRAKRLERAFARSLARIANAYQVDWALVLAVLRANGDKGADPATDAELEAVAERVAAAERRTTSDKLGQVGRALFADRPSFERKVDVLTRYNRAVGLRGLVEGLYAIDDRLAKRVLDSNRLSIYDAGRADVKNGYIDVRLLSLLLYLAERYDEITVTSLFSGHDYFARPGVPSAHAFGRAVDIAAINDTPVLGNQQPGGVIERVINDVLSVPHELQAAQLISLFQLGGPSFAAGDHADHIHVGF